MSSSVSSQSNQKNLAGLHGLRGFAAMLVFWYHARWKAGDPKLQIAGFDVRSFLQACDIGVCLFFVLSGYLLTTGYRSWIFNSGDSDTIRPPAYSAYLVRRIARIYPLYIFVLAVFALFSVNTYNFFGLLDVLLHVTCLHTCFSFSYTSINPVLWTIGIEFQFYLLLPFVLLTIGYLRRFVGIVLSLVVVLILAFLLQFLATQLQLHLSGMLPEKLINPISPPQTVFFFLPWFWIGICLSLLGTIQSNSNRSLQHELSFVLSVVLFVGLIALATEGQWRTISVWGWPLNAVASAGLIYTVGQSSLGLWCFENRLMRWLGDLSFGIYLWHWPVMTAVFAGTLPGRLGQVGALVGCGLLSLVVTLGLSQLTFRLIEQPAIRFGRDHLSLQSFFRSSVRFVWPDSWRPNSR